jgi:hypothetical protein
LFCQSFLMWVECCIMTERSTRHTGIRGVLVISLLPVSVNIMSLIPGGVNLKTKITVASLLHMTTVGVTSKNWLAWNHDNISEFSDVYQRTVISVSSYYETWSQCVGLVQHRYRLGLWCLTSLSTNLQLSWRSFLFVEEIGVPGENHRPVVSRTQTLLYNVVSATPLHEWYSKSQL